MHLEKSIIPTPINHRYLPRVPRPTKLTNFLVLLLLINLVTMNKFQTTLAQDNSTNSNIITVNITKTESISNTENKTNNTKIQKTSQWRPLPTNNRQIARIMGLDDMKQIPPELRVDSSKFNNNNSDNNLDMGNVTAKVLSGEDLSNPSSSNAKMVYNDHAAENTISMGLTIGIFTGILLTFVSTLLLLQWIFRKKMGYQTTPRNEAEMEDF